MILENILVPVRVLFFSIILAGAPHSLSGAQIFNWVNDDPASTFAGTVILDDWVTGDFNDISFRNPERPVLSWSFQVPYINVFARELLVDQWFNGWSMGGTLDGQGNLTNFSFSGGAGGASGSFYLRVSDSSIIHRAEGGLPPGSDPQTFDVTNTTVGHWSAVSETGSTLGLVGFAFASLVLLRRRLARS